jgi:hypothetical protein
MGSADTIIGSRGTSAGVRAGRLPCRAMLLIVILLLSLGLAACTDDSAQQVFDNAQFEERQNNQAHAKQLYQEILTKYPKSEYARKAEDRLREIEPKK